MRQKIINNKERLKLALLGFVICAAFVVSVQAMAASNNTSIKSKDIIMHVVDANDTPTVPGFAIPAYELPPLQRHYGELHIVRGIHGLEGITASVGDKLDGVDVREVGTFIGLGSSGYAMFYADQVNNTWLTVGLGASPIPF